MRDPFAVSAAEAQHLAETFGTPLYVVDESHLREKIRAYIDGFASVYPHTEISFASKANSTLAVLQIAADEGCTIDTASEGELEAALRAGVPPPCAPGSPPPVAICTAITRRWLNSNARPRKASARSWWTTSRRSSDLAQWARCPICSFALRPA